MQASSSAAAASQQSASEPMRSAQAPHARTQTILKFVVVALGVVMVAGLALVIGRIIYLASAPPAQPAASSTVSSTQTLQLPHGSEVRSISLSGNQMAVHYEMPEGSGIAILDLATGRETTHVSIVFVPAGN
jgi:hypothetical protein